MIKPLIFLIFIAVFPVLISAPHLSIPMVHLCRDLNWKSGFLEQFPTPSLSVSWLLPRFWNLHFYNWNNNIISGKKKKILEHMAHTCWVNLNRLGHAPGSRAVCDVCVDPRRLCLRGLFLYKKTSIRYILWLHWFNDKYINILSWTIFLDLRVYFSSEVKGMKRFSWALKVS